MLNLTFRQTPAERMVRIAASLVFDALQKAGTKLVSLSSLTEDEQYGFTASATLEPVGPKFVRITDLQDGRVDWETVPYCECPDPEKYLLKNGDILFARTGATTGKTFLLEDDVDAVFASYLIRVRPSHGVRSDYLYSFFQSDLYWSQIVEGKEGSAQPNVNGRKLMAVQVPLVDAALQGKIAEFLRAVRRLQDGDDTDLPLLPPPIEGQRKVVARLHLLSNRLSAARTLRQQSLSLSLALEKSRISELFLILAGSHRATVENIADVRGGIQKSSDRTPNANPQRYITVAHVQRGRIDTGDPRYFEVSPAELERWRLRAGDVLVIEGNGSADQIGRAALFMGEIEDCVHQNHVIRLRPDPALILPSYLNAYLNSPDGQDEMLALSRTTSGLFNLSVGRIKGLALPVPSLDVQSHIVERIDKVHAETAALTATQIQSAMELEAVMPSLLSQTLLRNL